jgi:hypothetical protein
MFFSRSVVAHWILFPKTSGSILASPRQKVNFYFREWFLSPLGETAYFALGFPLLADMGEKYNKMF